MNEGIIFAIGSVLFIMLSWVTMSFLLLQFSAQYQDDQAETPAPTTDH